MRVADGVYQLTGGICNFYLIEDAGKFVLVDAGAPADWKLLLPALTRLHHTLEDLDAVLLTHAHSDHTGFAERARQTAHVQVWINQADEDVARGAKAAGLQGSVAKYLLRLEAYRTLISLSLRGATRIIPIAEVSTFEDGDTIDVPAHPRAIHAPGHTAGSSAILLEARGILFTGDSLVTRNPLTGRKGPQIMPYPLNRDTQQALRSLDFLAKNPASMVLPGHGAPWTQGAQDAVHHAKQAGIS